jgi:surface antigen
VGWLVGREVSVRNVPEGMGLAKHRASPRLLHMRAAFLSALVILSGCGLSGNAMKKVEDDPALVTSSVSSQASTDQDAISDIATIRNAVSSANLEATGGKPLSWANQDTGSRGQVTSIAEANQDGRVCRKFETSRESFEGISLFTGKTCLNDDGQWSVLSFDAI